ncbi:MAG: hypothetical protein DMD91_07940 [Candidatus Rokuibacteriota bacterium]|nr:MAG: hypothetical protein DMD91_07940 [Candidatus Rokubacteria bacterium]
MTPRKRRLVLVAVAVALLGVAIAGAWYVLGEERRFGRLVSGILSARLGVPVSVERGATRGTSLWLRGVRVPAGGGSSVEISVGQLDVAGGILPLVAPAGRGLTIVATSTSITLRDGAQSTTPTATIEAVREAVAAALGWPGTLSVRIVGGQVTRGGRTFALELTGEKTATGLGITLALLDAGAPALRLTTQSSRGADGVVTSQVDFTGVPSHFAGLWPTSWPSPAHLAGRADVRLARGGNLTASARLTAGDTTTPVVIDLTSRWDPVKLELTGSAEGTIDGAVIRAHAAYETTGGSFDGEVTIEPFSLQSLARRLNTTTPAEITARTVVTRFTGTSRGARAMASLDLTGRAVTTPALPRLPLDAALTATIELATDRASLIALEVSTLTLTRDGRPVGRFTAASHADGLWPIAIRGDVDDAAAVASLLPVPARLAGRASVAGEIASASPLAFQGTVQAQLTEVDVTTGGSVKLGGVRATVPVGFGVAAPPAGTLTIERVNAYGITATGLTSSARLNEGRLLLPDLRYAQYGGQGGGWLEAAIDGRPTPMRARLEASRIDLAALVRDVGTGATQITGHVHYVLTAQYTNDRGLAAIGQLASDEGGGEVSIEPIQRLLDSATVQAEATGVLQQTLQNLRVFNYESLDGTLTWTQGAGHIDLSLKGKKRLGIFPGPVEAINFRNVPLTVLARTLSRGTTP